MNCVGDQAGARVARDCLLDMRICEEETLKTVININCIFCSYKWKKYSSMKSNLL